MVRKRRTYRKNPSVPALQAKEIGRRISFARHEADHMTQAQLAELLNVSLRSVQDYERGSTVPWKHFSRLEEIFTRPLGWFLHGDPVVPQPILSPAMIEEPHFLELRDEFRLDRDRLLDRLDAIEEALRVLMVRLDQLAESPRPR